MLKSHIHMIRALNALMSDESFDLDHVSESLNYKQTLKSRYWSEWKKIMKHEIEEHLISKIWYLKRLSKRRIVIIERWMFRIKYDIDEVILRFKARWIVHEYKQKHDIDYFDTWTDVVKSIFFRTLFAFVVFRRMHAEQMNIVTVFLYELLNEIIYVIQSDEFIENSDLICHLIKTLYDLKQSLRVWYEVIRDFLKSLRFELIEFDHFVFVSKNKKTYIVVYVDDLLIVSDDMIYINEIKAKLTERFKMIDLESAQQYLSIEIIREEKKSILLRQITYLKKILKRFDMQNCKIVSIFMNSDLMSVIMSSNEDHQTHEDIIYWYDFVVDSLMFAIIMTRSDFVQALEVLSRYCINSDFTHVVALQHLFRYIQGTLDLDIDFIDVDWITFFEKFSDVDWAEAIDERHYTEDYIFFVTEDVVSWSSKRQNVIALFSCESEYYDLVEAKKEALWIRQLFTKLSQYDISTSAHLWMNNQSVKALSENSEFHRRIKHIDVRYHWVREKVTKETLQLKYISTEQMIADDLTKSLERQTFQRFLTLIHMTY